jgi:hypothetical protein
MVAVAVVDEWYADLMELPGANRSRQVPMLEKLDRASVEVVDPTVMAFAARAGE